LKEYDPMREPLSEQEVRVLGCLIEKERTTPEYYPLTRNALVLACNQKSNRSPVVSYTHDGVAEVLDALRWKGWVAVVDEAGSRVEKYRHRFGEKTGLGAKEIAVLAELMLRGPQTSGEIRGRASRMQELGGIEDVQQILARLAEGEEPWVVRLERQRGLKERRYAHLLSGEPALAAVELSEDEEPVAGRVGARNPESGRANPIEEEVAALRARIEELERIVEELRARAASPASSRGPSETTV
jgi:uncharacterized protein YceH (UPF0502 family)